MEGQEEVEEFASVWNSACSVLGISEEFIPPIHRNVKFHKASSMKSRLIDFNNTYINRLYNLPEGSDKQKLEEAIMSWCHQDRYTCLYPDRLGGRFGTPQIGEIFLEKFVKGMKSKQTKVMHFITKINHITICLITTAVEFALRRMLHKKIRFEGVVWAGKFREYVRNFQAQDKQVQKILLQAIQHNLREWYNRHVQVVPPVDTRASYRFSCRRTSARIDKGIEFRKSITEL